ncbi:FecR family protein [Edaphosphingomonas haloaromaticamans]|uniref:Fec operon regulator FecR n=1 Tax=Edaphosphingomonas haloaromaticamans TaxID=653954 RepID=A0A1S1HAJ6_9SPHN|nr:FecR domain-containing protein [Sphingomonas haloaromaticamans]OHT19108.1 fec operon regulator FecR [Sphingomonas haloaromaticamans]
MAAPGLDSGAPDPVREQAIAWLVRLRAGPTDRERVEFEDWYAADPRHADTYDALLDSWEDTALAAQVPAARRDPQPAPRHPWMKVAVVAAAVLLVLAAGSLVLTNNMRNGTDGPAMLASRVGEIREIALEDGSRVTLDTNSVVRVNYNDGQRRLRLERGRARFEVAHDARRPFVVVAGTSEVVAHGTVFDVDLRERQALVSLLQGSVEVRQPAAAGTPARSTMLRPGQQLAFGDTRTVTAPVAIRAAETRWPSGMLSFEDVPLAEVVASANRYNRTQIVLGDPEVEERRFTGTFRAGEPAQLADMIGSMFGLSVRRNQDGNLMLTAAK